MLCAALTLCAAVSTTTVHAAPAPATESTPASIDAQAALARMRGLPLRFEPNRGQTSDAVKFLARFGTHTLFLTSDGAVVRLSGQGASEPSESILRLRWLGVSDEAVVAGIEELPGKSNYLIGRDSTKWQTNVPNYAKVRYRDLYPGVDLLYYGDGGRLEYDLVVAPGAETDRLRLKVDGASSIGRDGDGNLELGVATGNLRLLAPVAYQESRDASGQLNREHVDVDYEWTSDGEIHFRAGAYDRTRPLIIDPQITYSSYIGGSGSDSGDNVVVDPSGAAYIVGWSRSLDFPLAAPFQSQNTSATMAVVVKMNPELPGAASMMYSTYLGGSSGNTVGRGIAINGAGQIFVGGDTSAPDFPVTTGAYQTTCRLNGAQCSTDAFAVKLDATGAALLYGTYVGGSGTELGFDLAIDGSDHIFLTGPTGSSDFPMTAGAYQTTFAGGGTTFGDAFVAKLNPAGAGAGDLLYSTFLGGSGSETSWTIAADAAGDIYVGGNTTSSGFPTTPNAFSTTYSGAGAALNLGDAFIAKLRPGGTGSPDLLYSTFLGGSSDERVSSLVVDTNNTVYATGWTTSASFPTTANAYQTVFGGGTCSSGSPCADAFVLRLDPSGSGIGSLWYSTLFGGSSFDLSNGIALDSAGFVYIAGETESPNLPLRNAIQNSCFGGCTPAPMSDVMLAKFDLSQPGQAALLFSTYIGGANVDTGWGLAVDTSGNAYITGQVFSLNYPMVLPFQAVCNNCTSFTSSTPRGDVFLTKVCTTNCPTVQLSAASLSFGNQPVATSSSVQTVTLTNAGTGNLTIGSIQMTGANPTEFGQTNDCPVVIAPTGSCTISVTFTPLGAGARSAAVTITDNGSGSPRSVTLSGTGTVPQAPPWPNGYRYQATFTVASGQVPTTLANVPVVISGTYADFKTAANGGAVVNTCVQTVGTKNTTVPCDLIFTSDAAGTALLNWEYDRYDATTGAVTAWVKVPTLASGMVVYGWYGNAAVTTLAAPAPTWSGDYLAAYHLGESTTGAAPQLMDSSASAHHGAMNGTVASGQQTTGQVGGSLNFASVRAWASLANASDFNFERTDAFSIAGWFKSSSNRSGTLVSKLDATSTTGWGLFQYATATTPRFSLGLQGNGGTGNYAMVATPALSMNAWHYVVATYSGTSTAGGMRIYVDGVDQPLSILKDTLTASIVNAAVPAAINGRGGATDMSYDGIDEVRVSSRGVVFSPEWVTATYNNQRSPSTFFSVVTSLTNSGSAPTVGVSPASLTFANQTISTTSAAQTVTVTNYGPGALTISTIAVTDTNAGDFSQTTTCPLSPAALSVSASCTINVTFTPTALGSRIASVTITDSGNGSPRSVSLSGTGVTAAPTVSLSPASLSFGNQTTNTTSTSQAITVTNNGPGVLTISSIAMTGTNAGDFAQTSNCPVSPSTLAASTNCTVNVTFTPTATGARSAALTIADDGNGSPQSASLSGAGVVPSVGLSPSSLTFAGQTINTTSAAQSVTLTNNGPGLLTIGSIAITGTNAGDFAKTTTCPSSPSTLAVSASCTISVTFTPTATGARSAAVTITDNGSGSPRSVTLSGTGTAPQAPPWPNGYRYQATFTVAAGQVAGTLTTVPVVISGTYADFKTAANGGAIVNTCVQTVGTKNTTVPCDLIFTADAAGTSLLNWEYDRYTATTGAVTVWVQVPTLASGTVIYAWYGNAAVTTVPAATPTWSGDYLAAYHLGESTTGVAPQLMDSSATAHHGTMNGTVASGQQTTGQVGGSLNFLSVRAWASLASASDFNFERTDSFSIAGWFKTSTNKSGSLVTKLDATSTTGWGLFQYGTATTPRFALALQGNGGAGNYAQVATPAIAYGWHYVVATTSGTGTVAGMKIYVDGVNQPLTVIADALTVSIVNAAAPAVINGRGGATDMSYDGIDEVRVSSRGVVFSPDWVTTTYNNQRSPGAFFSVVTGLTNPGGS